LTERKNGSTAQLKKRKKTREKARRFDGEEKDEGRERSLQTFASNGEVEKKYGRREPLHHTKTD